MKPASILALSIIAAACASCMNPAIDPVSPAIPSGTNVEVNSGLFTASETDPAITFTTNDAKYITANGYTLWAPIAGTQNPFSSRSVSVAKMSGDQYAGYGIVFCHYDAGANETMLVAMINTKRQFLVGEAIGSEFTPWTEWTDSTALLAGFNIKNTIRVALVGGEFVLYLNGVEASRFRDEETPYHNSGADGYIVVISPLDSFPGIPACVTFEEN